MIYNTLYLNSSEQNIYNAGIISATSTSNVPSVGIIALNQQNQNFSIINSGSITADYAIMANGLNIVVQNQSGGNLTGSIILGSFNDTLINDGEIKGNISTNNGDDFLDTSNGYIDGVINLGVGADVFYGSAEQDLVYGESHNDRLEGRAGNDLLIGGGGDDTLIGGSGADGLYGEIGDDLIVTEGADVAYGGLGNDVFQSQDLAFTLIDGEAGVDDWLVPLTAKPLDLSLVAASGRVRNIEVVSVHPNSDLVVRAEDVAAITGSNRLFIGEHSAPGSQPNSSKITLVGDWEEGDLLTDAAGTWRVFSQNGTTVLVLDRISTVEVTATGPDDVLGLDDLVAGDLPPAPGVSTGLYLGQPVYVAEYQPADGERIAFGEVWISSNGRSTVLSEFPAFRSFGNDGVIITDGALRQAVPEGAPPPGSPAFTP